MSGDDGVRVGLNEDMSGVSLTVIPIPGSGRAIRTDLSPLTARWVARALLEHADTVEAICAEKGAR